MPDFDIDAWAALGEAGFTAWELEMPAGKIRFKTAGNRKLEADISKLQYLHDYQELIHPLDKAAFHNTLDALIKGDLNKFHAEYRLRMPDGSWKWMEQSGGIASRKEGHLLLRGVILDVDRRKQLEIQQDRASRILYDSPSNVMTTDIYGAITFVNPRFTEITGFEPDEVLGRHAGFLNAAEPDKTFMQHLMEDLKSGKTWKGEFHNRRKDGSTYYESAQISPMKDDAGNITAFIKTAEDISKIKEAEHQIEKMAREYKNVLEYSSDVLLVIENQRVTYASPSFKEINGLPMETIMGKTTDVLFEPVHPDDKKPLYDAIYQAIDNNKKQLRTEYRFMHPDGKNHWHEDHIRFLYDSGGRHFKSIVLSRDITERKEHKEHERSVMEALPDMLFEFDQKGNFVYFHAPHYHELYAPPEDFIGKNVSEALPPEYTKLTMDNIRKALRTRKVQHYSYSMPIHGEERFYEVRMVPKGEKHTIAIVRSATEKRRLQHENIYLEGFRKMLTDLAADFINLQPEDSSQKISAALKTIGEFTEADRAYIFSYDLKNSIMNNTYEWCAPGVVPQLPELQKISVNTLPEQLAFHYQGQTYAIQSMQAHIRKPDTDKFWLQATFLHTIKSLITFPMIHDGELLGFVGFDSEKTERIWSEAEKDLLMLFAELITSLKIKIRNEKKLRIAKEQAEESDRLKSAFLLNLSHEVRTPMNGIMGFAELLKDAHLSESKQKLYLEMIQQSSQRMLNIIDDLVDASVIEAGQISVNKKEIGLLRFSRQIYELHHKKAEEKGLTFKFEQRRSHEEVFVASDPEKLQKILGNLIENAVKYNRPGGYVDFSIKMEADQVSFCIRDNGIGIRQEDQKKIFQPFVQADSSLNSLYEGAGLGLSIAQSFAEAIGGRIQLESEPGKGSVFSLTIPSR